jgi:hypothetical protein
LELYSHASKDYDFARCHQLLSEEQYVVSLPAYGEFPSQAQVFVEWPVYWLDSFMQAWFHAEGHQYLLSRWVSPETAHQFSIRYDVKRQMVVAPYWDVFGRLAGARGRKVTEGGQQHFDYTFQGVNNARLVWYHEQVLNDPGPVVVVEGQFDLWRTVQAYKKTVAALTAKPTLEKMKKLGDCGTVIQIPDLDEAGEQSIGVYAKYCQQLGLKHKVVRLGEGVKDPAECHVDYLRDRIQEML